MQIIFAIPPISHFRRWLGESFFPTSKVQNFYHFINQLVKKVKKLLRHFPTVPRVIYFDKDSKKKFIFFTNALTISPIMVAELYHNRWKIELFFKWIKQDLKIKKFWGTSENAVRIQIYSAIIAYCMMAIVQKKMNVERSIYEMLQIVSISLTDTTNLRDLFARPNCNIVNELDDSTEPNLFNC